MDSKFASRIFTHFQYKFDENSNCFNWENHLSNIYLFSKRMWKLDIQIIVELSDILSF